MPADPTATAPRARRADARQNLDALLEAAKAEFALGGVDAPVRAIAERAGVGVGTLYRHFPLRSDLITAVFRREMDACAAAAAELADAHDPGAALDAWTLRFMRFVATKRGLAAALHSGDPAYEPLRTHFERTLTPALERLLAAARADGAIVRDVDADDFLAGVSDLCHGTDGPRSERLVRLLLAGLRTA